MYSSVRVFPNDTLNQCFSTQLILRTIKNFKHELQTAKHIEISAVFFSYSRTNYLKISDSAINLYTNAKQNDKVAESYWIQMKDIPSCFKRTNGGPRTETNSSVFSPTLIPSSS